MMRCTSTVPFVASLFAATTAVAQSRQCVVDSQAPWAVVSRTWSHESGSTWSNHSLRRVLLALERKDQEARRDFGARATDSTYGRELLELDERTSAVAKGILDRFGLPTKSMVGAAGRSRAIPRRPAQRLEGATHIIREEDLRTAGENSASATSATVYGSRWTRCDAFAMRRGEPR
jgi:hypothetical protein